MNPQLVLATKQFDQLNQLVSREVETLEFELVERKSDTGLPDGGWMELLPYASISAYDPTTGDMKFAARQTFDQAQPEPQLVSSSIGFAAPIDSIDHITCTRMDVRDDGSKVYHMSMPDLLTTAVEATKANLEAVIGFDPLEKFNIDVATSMRFTFFNNIDQEGSTDKDRFGVSIPLTLPLELVAQVYQSANGKQPSAELHEFVINAGNILMSFDVSETATKAIQGMSADHKFDPWSVMVISQQLLQYFEMIRSHVSYTDIIQAVKKNVDAMRAHEEAHQVAMQQAQEAMAKAEQQDAANAAGTDLDISVNSELLHEGFAGLDLMRDAKVGDQPVAQASGDTTTTTTETN